ncbi:DNA repair protein RecO [Sandaracinus amylolyticus]|uniref:DNA repair protein RecO n=1 Tax=Sandaracinus amylolyticus TaxID=927083 RepID=A0A0F6W6E5_9BACT|nr:DNA repair protein RecO [Sandaracinus amylolyticus]AKF08573.1 DNA recombination and repair protein RecO [Sandaracinus amylolyticus]
MSQTELTHAVVLRSVAYGEADRILTLLTEAHGKVSLMARNARASRRRFPGGALEPFGLIEIEMALGRGDVGRLASARLVRGFPRLLGSLECLSEAGGAIELLRELVPPREPDVRWLVEVERFFEVLDARAPEPGIEVRLAFTLRALALMGLSPRLDACGRCGRRAEDRAALFDAGLGAIVCRACGGGPLHLAASTRAHMIASQRDAWTDAVQGWDERARSEAESAIDAFVRRHVGRTRSEG